MALRVSLILFLVTFKCITVGYAQTSWNSKPLAGFMISGGGFINCGTEVSFLDTSSLTNPCNAAKDSCDSIVSWEWNFGDGSISTLEHPIYEYTHAHFRNTVALVRLKVRSKFGYSDSIILPIYIADVWASFRVLSDTIIEVDDSVVFSKYYYSNSHKHLWQWDFGNGITLPDSIDQNVVYQYNAVGKYDVYLTLHEDIFIWGSNKRCSATYPDSSKNQKKITITVNKPSGIPIFSDSELSVFPNPTDGAIRLEFSNAAYHADISVFNLLGELVFEKKDVSDLNTKLDIGNLPEGIYLLRVVDANTSISQRIVLVK